MEITRLHDVIPVGQSLHLVFQTVRRPVHVDVSVIDRDDLRAVAVLDAEGWCVIVVENVTDAPVTITPLEPLRLVVMPQRRKS